MKKQHNAVWQFIAYVFVGGTAFVCDAGLYLILIGILGNAGVGSIVSNLIGNTAGFCVGVVVNYFLSILFVFDAKSNMRDFLAVVVIGIIGLAINDGCILLFNNVLSVPALIAKVIANAIVFVWNYGARKLTIYKGK